MPTLCRTIIEFGVSWDAIYWIPTSTYFNNLYMITGFYANLARSVKLIHDQENTNLARLPFVTNPLRWV